MSYVAGVAGVLMLMAALGVWLAVGADKVERIIQEWRMECAAERDRKGEKR